VLARNSPFKTEAAISKKNLLLGHFSKLSLCAFWESLVG
jgi:hypothetical protein